MEERLTSMYSIKDAQDDTLFIPRVSTELFRDGNRLPLLRAAVHLYDSFGRYREALCYSAPGQTCKLCDAAMGEVHKAAEAVKLKMEQLRADMGHEQDSSAEASLRETELEMKLAAFSGADFKLLQRVYIVAAKINQDTTPVTFKLVLLSFTLDSYIRNIKDILMSSDESMCVRMTYPNTESVRDKAALRKIEVCNPNFRGIEDLKDRATREIQGLTRLDIEMLRPELGIASYNSAAKMVRL